MKKLFVFLALFLCFIVGCKRKTGIPFQEELRALHNHERSQVSISNLKRNISLERMAQRHAEWMASTGKFVHSDLDLGGWHIMGENIAMGQRNSVQVTTSWMKSPGHRANILNKKFKYVGFGHSISKKGVDYWCTVFGG